MEVLYRQLAAEGVKHRRSAILHILWLMPVLFLILEFLFFERPLLGQHSPSPKTLAIADDIQLKMVVTLWGGIFHPLFLALLPALLFRPEHRYRTWRHLHLMPTPRRGIFLAKAVYALICSAGVLLLISLLLWLERWVLGLLNPAMALPFHGLRMMKALGWLWLGSLPILAIYLWVADRINSLAVPLVFGLVGLLLTVALTGQELPQPWRRDLIPWVTPFAAAQQVILSGAKQQEVHSAGRFFQPEPNVLRLPSGRKVKTWQNIPDEELFPPPKPTPSWMFSVFSSGAGLLVLALAWVDSGRCRI